VNESGSKQLWRQVTVAVSAEAVEAVSAFLGRFGTVAVEELHATPTSAQSHAPVIRVHCYLEEERARACEQQIAEGLWHLGQLMPLEAPVMRTLAEDDWMQAWKEHFPVLHITERLVVVPAWREYSPREREVAIVIEPGTAFGTGLHPSTRLALQALEQFIRVGDTVLDVGTGTGILAIAAAKLGAERVLALDIDKAAVRAARHNVDLNGVARVVEVNLGSVLPPPPPQDLLQKPVLVREGRYNILMANIFAEVIAEMAGALVELSAEGAHIITSGITQERAEIVLQAFGGRAALCQRLEDGDWVCLCFCVP